jgi:DNA polymerase III delta prime subunit
MYINSLLDWNNMEQLHDTDLRFTMLPRWFDGCWNYPRQKSLRLLEKQVATNHLPTFSIFNGPAGSGKNVAAYILGMAASCPNWDRNSHRPCGRCKECDFVRLDRKTSYRGGLVEIDGASKQFADAPMVFLRHAYEHTEFYNRGFVDFVGDKDRKTIVFINEAQRLTLGTKEALLTMLERWENAHIIAATTDLGRMQIDPELAVMMDPLLSRSDIYHFEWPTAAEAVAGLIRAAKSIDIELTENAARIIARRNSSVGANGLVTPRGCLGDLYKVAALGSYIDVDALELIEAGSEVEVEPDNDESQPPTDAVY